jgi:membrane protease YdiL (CAAX protease family)
VGPGRAEACLWAAGYLLAQSLAVVLFLALLLWFAFDGRWPDRDFVLPFLAQLQLDSSFLLVGVTSLGALFLLVPAARLRMGRGIRERLWVQPPETRHAILAAGTVVPLAVLSNELYAHAQVWWTSWSAAEPILEVWGRANSLDLLRKQLSGTPFWIVMVALALGPAIGEELVFRGVVGQGLIARRGVVRGVLWTTVLFAAMHLFPPHAVATVPLALFFHYAYLTTRSFWVPVLLHGLNNALTISMLTFPEVRELPASPLLLLCSALYVLVVGVLLWQTRRGGAGQPEDAADLRLPVLWWPAKEPAGGRVSAAVAGSCIVSFTTVFVWSALVVER